MLRESLQSQYPSLQSSKGWWREESFSMGKFFIDRFGSIVEIQHSEPSFPETRSEELEDVAFD